MRRELASSTLDLTQNKTIVKLRNEAEKINLVSICYDTKLLREVTLAKFVFACIDHLSVGKLHSGLIPQRDLLPLVGILMRRRYLLEELRM